MNELQAEPVVTYKFRTEQPIHRDALVLVCVRYTIGADVARSEVLTTDGWREFKEYEVLPSNLPEMDALQVLRQKDQRAYIDGRLAELEALMTVEAGR